MKKIISIIFFSLISINSFAGDIWNWRLYSADSYDFVIPSTHAFKFTFNVDESSDPVTLMCSGIKVKVAAGTSIKCDKKRGEVAKFQIADGEFVNGASGSWEQM